MKATRFPSTLKMSSLILMVTLATTMTGCTAGTPGSNDSTIHIQTAKATHQTLTAPIELTGVLNPDKTVIISSKIQSQVEKVTFKVGDSVKKGDVLILLDRDSLSSQLKQAQAALRSAQAASGTAVNQAETARLNITLLEKSYEDTLALYKNDSASENQLIEAKNKLDLARNQLANATGPMKQQADAAIGTAKANVDTVALQLKNATLTSPIDAIVLSRNIQEGEVASSGASLLTLADVSKLRLKGTVPQDALPFLSVGQKIPVSVDIYPDKTFEGYVDSIGPMAVSTGKIFPVEITLVNNSKLLAGLSAKAVLPLTKKNCLVIPNSALVQNNGSTYVFVIENVKALKRTVTTGLRSADTTEILNGLKDSETIAISNTAVLLDGMSVTEK